MASIPEEENPFIPEFSFPGWFLEPGRRPPTPEEMSAWIEHHLQFINTPLVKPEFDHIVNNLDLAKTLEHGEDEEVSGMTICIRLLMNSLWDQGRFPEKWVLKQPDKMAEILLASNERIREETLRVIIEKKGLMEKVLKEKNGLSSLLEKHIALGI